MSELVRTSLDSPARAPHRSRRLCRVSIRLRPRATTGQAQLHPRLCSKPPLALDLRLLATNFVRFDVEPRWGSLFVTHSYPVCAVRHWALEWNCFAVLSSPERRMEISPSIAPIYRFKHLAFTPTALNSGAQRRGAHAGVPTAPMIEPQRGSTNYYQNALGLIRYF